MEIIDVIDTAVKVGLGALISGITTYYVSKANHRSDRQKEAEQRTHDALVYVTEKTEKYAHAFMTAISTLEGMLRSGVAPGPLAPAALKHYMRADAQLIESRPDLLAAMSRIQLLGETKIAEALRELPYLEDQFRERVVFKAQLPRRDELDQLRDKLGGQRDKVMVGLSAIFKKGHN